MSSEKYYLTPNEFSVISAGFGISKVYGLKQLDRVNNKEICIALHNMYLNQLIENKEAQEFVADEELTKFMRIIKSTKRVIIIDFSTDDRINTICCYYAKIWAIIEESFLNPDRIIMYFDAWERLVDNIMEVSENHIVAIRLIDVRNGYIISEDFIAPEEQKADKKAALDKYYKGVTDL